MMAFPGPLVQSRAKSCAIVLLAVLLIAGCASGSGKSKPGEAARILRDQRITRAQLDVFPGRSFTFSRLDGFKKYFVAVLLL